MKVMVIVKASKASEAGEMPSTELLTAMGKFNEELAKAGMLIAGEGLHPSSKGVRVHFSGKNRTVTDGPFTETKELIAGFWLWEVASLQQAIDWVRRCPNPHDEDSEIEIRPVFGTEDFDDALTPELKAQEERLRASTQAKSGARQAARQTMKHGLAPHLVIAGATQAIDFYKKAFGAQEKIRLPGPDGKLMHAAVVINGSMVMLVDENPKYGMLSPKSLNGTPVTINLEVADVDAFVDRAVKAGAKLTMPVADMFWGDRYGVIEDPFGHSWAILTHQCDMTEAELKDAASKALSGQAPADAAIQR